MNTMELVRFVDRAPPRPAASGARTPLFPSELLISARQSILCARQFLLSEQRADGSWLGAHIGDASISGQLTLSLAYLGRETSPLAQQAATTILDRQLPTGGWSAVADGADDVSTSVQCYFALKLTGLAAGDERLRRARQVIRRLGGADAADATTRFFLALLGQIDYDRCPAIPPELLLFDSRDRRRRSSLSLIWSHRPVRKVGIERGARELFIDHPCTWPTPIGNCQDNSRTPLPRFVLSLRTWMWQCCERRGWVPLRRRALERAESLMLEHIDPMRIGHLDFRELLWHTIALDAIGYPKDSRERQACEARLQEMICTEQEGERSTPRLRTTPFADTLIALSALRASGTSGHHPCIAAATTWLSRSRRSPISPNVLELAGIVRILCESAEHDAVAQRALPPSIEVTNRQWENADNVDDTNSQLDRLRPLSAALFQRLLQQQSRDGGWGAADVTGRVIEAIAVGACEKSQSAIDRALGYLRVMQRADGSWSGSSRQVHATALAVRGLLAGGASNEDDAVAAGINWLTVEQQPGGDWGDSPSLTALALLALVSAGQANEQPALKAVNYLLETQQDDGCWNERQLVLRDAAANCWFRSDLHAVAWPLEALSRWTVAAAPSQGVASDSLLLRLVGATADE